MRIRADQIRRGDTITTDPTQYPMRLEVAGITRTAIHPTDETDTETIMVTVQGLNQPPGHSYPTRRSFAYAAAEILEVLR